MQFNSLSLDSAYEDNGSNDKNQCGSFLLLLRWHCWFGLGFLTKSLFPLNCDPIKKKTRKKLYSLPGSLAVEMMVAGCCLTKVLTRACVGGGMLMRLPALIKSSHGLCCSSSVSVRTLSFQVTIKKRKTVMTKPPRCWHLTSCLRAQTQRVRHRHRQKIKNPITHLSILFTSHCECSLGNARGWSMEQKTSGWAFIHIWMTSMHFECR